MNGAEEWERVKSYCFSEIYIGSRQMLFDCDQSEAGQTETHTYSIWESIPLPGTEIETIEWTWFSLWPPEREYYILIVGTNKLQTYHITHYFAQIKINTLLRLIDLRFSFSIFISFTRLHTALKHFLSLSVHSVFVFVCVCVCHPIQLSITQNADTLPQMQLTHSPSTFAHTC